MVSQVLTDGARAGCYIVSEASNPQRSREQGALAAGNALAAGTVVGRLTATKEFTAYDPAAATGAEVVAGILFDNVSAGTAAKRAVFSVRDMEANGHELVWPSGSTPSQKAAGEAALAKLGIIVRY